MALRLAYTHGLDALIGCNLTVYSPFALGVTSFSFTWGEEGQGEVRRRKEW